MVKAVGKLERGIKGVVSSKGEPEVKGALRRNFFHG